MDFKKAFIAWVCAFSAVSCVNVDTHLGQDFIPVEQQYEVHTAEFPLENVKMKLINNLSGYSSRRITVGAIKDETFGLTTRSSAFTVVPLDDTLNFGKNAKFRDFHLSFARDTISAQNESQKSILQNINVYSLRDAGISLNADVKYTVDIKNSDFDALERITDGVPVYNGGDSLNFSFSKKFGEAEFQKMLSLCDENGVYRIDSVAAYTKEFPGIFMSCDQPVGHGGRFNFFDVALGYESSYITGNFAELKFTADYGAREAVDTSFYFIYGPTGFTQATNLPEQFAFNVSTCGENLTGGAVDGSLDVNDIIYVEGGTGLKPVFSSEEIRSKILGEFEAQGISGEGFKSVAINKATIEIPFEFPDDYTEINLFPTTLSATCCIKKDEDGKTTYTYTNLTDASISAENHGEINLSNLVYSPDISFHAQKIVNLEDPDAKTFDNYDIWFLIMAAEVNTTSSNESSSQSDYYNQMMYYSYLNSMYGGYGGYGYGSYGYGGYGYGGYGYGDYGYSNYYNMLMYSSLYGQSGSTSEVVSELDRDRFYRARLNGPAASGRKPMLKLTYSFPKSAEE